jgi:tetratricopeptide (TPR) repeat protein
MRFPGRLIVAVVSGCLVARGLAAQEPAERVRLDSLRDWAAAQSDTTRLVAHERARMDVARANRDDPFIHMELGWIALRLGDLTGVKRHHDEAAGEFEWASELRPGWAYAWYWLGIAELNLGESDMIVIENIRQVLGIDHLSQAARAFTRAIQADPGFTDALVDLASTTLQQRARGRVMVALEALRTAAATPAASQPLVWLLRGRLERRIGEGDSALAAFRRYVAVGGDSVVGGVEIARAHAALAHADSAVATYRAALARRITAAGRAEIRRDLAWIGTAGELADYDSLPVDSIGAWVTDFWSARDVDDARRPGERLVEQFRRYAHATAQFQLVSRRRAFNVAFAIRDTSQNELDDRGLIYMRHGEATERVRYTPPGTGAEASESWLYRRQPPDENLIFHFAAIGDVQDFRLLQSLAHVCVRGSGGADQYAVGDQAGTVDPACYGTRANFAPVYERLQRGGSLYQNLLAEEREMVRRSVRRGLGTDSYRIAFAGELRPVLSTFVVGDADRRPELHVVFAVPAGRLHPVETATGVVYPLELRVVVFDSAGREVRTLDTLRAFRAAAALGPGSFLTEQLVLPLPPGTWHAHLVIRERGLEFGNVVRAQRVDAYEMARGFGVSDVVIGREGSGLVWRRPAGAGGDVPLNPLARFPENSAALLYYEIYGLPEGAAVDTRVVLRPEGGRSIFRRLFGGRSGGDLSYTTVTQTAARAAVRQRLELLGLRAGRYTLELTLTEPGSGRRVTRRDSFEIGGRAP